MSSNLNLYRRDQVYRLDQQAMQMDLQPSRQLMQKAAQAVWDALQTRWPECQHIVILAGAGNNGGDAFALGSIAHRQGIEVSLYMVGELTRQSAESAYYRDLWLESGGEIWPWSGELPQCDVIVDGLLGIGLNKNLDTDWQTMISVINAQDAIRVSIDIPSGLNADTGEAMPYAIKADLTVSFIGRKIGCWLADGPDFCGERVFDDLGISTSALNSQAPTCKMMDHANIRLPLVRLANSYKNQFGHVLVVGGGPGMPGAVRLSAMAALRSGAGLVSVCVHPDNYAAIASSDAEIMPGVWHDLPAMLERASVIVVGPGLGQSPAAADLLPLLAMGNRPMLVDADALRAEFLDAVQSDICVITPHPGEAARLLQCTSAQIQQDRLQAIDDLTQRWKAACVLKGSGSLVGQHQHQLSLCQYGHAGMATAGSGDVLSGLIAGYLAQGLSAIEAARSGVYVHALSAQDYAEDQAPECLIARDIIARIGRVSKQIRERQGRFS